MSEHPDTDHEVRPARRRLADATRALLDAVADTIVAADDAADADLEAAAASLEATADALYRATGRSPSDPIRTRAHYRTYGQHLPRSLLVGEAHPLSPVGDWRFVDDELEVRVRYGQVVEGPPGCVHGGVIALAFDELLGMVLALSGVAGMTGRLTVRYRTPTPLRTDLVARARVVSREGRRVVAHGELRAGDVVTAECEGLFVMPRGGSPLSGAPER